MDITAIAPTPPYAALIFDCDGTLANTIPVHARTWAATVRSLVGAELSQEWLYERRGMSAIELIQTLNSTFGYDLDATVVNTDRQRRYYDLIHQVVEIQAVADIARHHYGKVPMAVASGSDRSMVEATLDAVSLRSLFDTVVTINDVTLGKPAPDLFLLAAKRLGVAPQECIVYEDSDAGLEAARRAKMRAIDVRGLWLSNREHSQP